MTDSEHQLAALPSGVARCVRCSKRCRVASKVNPRASLFVKGTAQTGRFCAECVFVDFLRNCDIGPATALGEHYFDPHKPQPEYERGKPDRRFDPETLRLPHVQSQIRAIVEAAARQYGAELTFAEIDWDEVIANWSLPFPARKQRRTKGEKP